VTSVLKLRRLTIACSQKENFFAGREFLIGSGIFAASRKFKLRKKRSPVGLFDKPLHRKRQHAKRRSVEILQSLSVAFAVSQPI
jgi:hypothetical protein